MPNLVHDFIKKKKILKVNNFVEPATARHRDSDPMAANVLKASYFRRLKIWMFHTLLQMPHVMKFPSVTCPMSLTSFPWFSDYLKKIFFVMLNSLLL